MRNWMVFSIFNIAFSNFKADPNEVPIDIPLPQSGLRAAALPEEFDWRERGKVTGVRSQGSCGSCWAFVATAIYESQVLIHGGQEHDLAEQVPLQCTRSSSCSGGYPKYALQNITSRGMPSESQVPYRGNTWYYSSNICYTAPAARVNNRVISIKTYYGSLSDN